MQYARSSRLLPWTLGIVALGAVHCGDAMDAEVATDAGPDGSIEVPLDGGPEPQPDADAALCEVGSAECDCDDAVCHEGECVLGVCLECKRGSEGCVCMSNGACGPGLTCEQGLCAVCESGQEGCPCTEDSCEGGQVCMNDVCVNERCEPGLEGCTCSSDGPACEGSGYCDDNDMCRECATDVLGCPCGDGSTCSGGLACMEGSCEERVSCEDLVERGDCLPNQRCGEGSDGMPRCEPESCVAGYRWDEGTADWRECESDVCSSGATCAPGEPESIAELCAAQFKGCVEDAWGARCEGCLDGATAVGSTCAPATECGDTTCSGSSYCDGGTCKDLPCAVGEAQTKAGECAPCPACVGDGLTGRPWPFQNNEDECICETVEGYFMPTDTNTDAEQCDADGDGWVRKEADTPQVRGDEAHRQNSRCEILLVDGVVLVDEYGLELEVGSCGASEGLVKDPTGTGADDCLTRTPMRLLESGRNDIPGAPTGPSAPVYEHLEGAEGRHLTAQELTSLTKACVTAIADYNDDGRRDLTEEQRGMPPGPALALDQQRLLSFAYFTELYRGSYRPAVEPGPGKFVIEERSRCDPDFPLGYDEGAAYSTVLDAENPSYWRNCGRRRDARFDADGTGFDFAQWSCDRATGSCDALPPAHADYDVAELTAADSVLRGHGLCELDGARPRDGKWRGMGHHSQFKCVQITATATDADAGRYNKDEFFGASPSMILNLCEATETEPSASGSDAYAPVVSCAAQDPGVRIPAEVTVGWAAVNFIEYGNLPKPVPLEPWTPSPGGNDGLVNDYQRGCVSEDAEYGLTLCPYPSFELERTDALKRDRSYGRYSCGEDQAFVWANDAIASDAATLWWDGANAAGVPTVLR